MCLRSISSYSLGNILNTSDLLTIFLIFKFDTYEVALMIMGVLLFLTDSSIQDMSSDCLDILNILDEENFSLMAFRLTWYSAFFSLNNIYSSIGKKGLINLSF
jgi:hypothetical protein